MNLLRVLLTIWARLQSLMNILADLLIIMLIISLIWKGLLIIKILIILFIYLILVSMYLISKLFNILRVLFSIAKLVILLICIVLAHLKVIQLSKVFYYFIWQCLTAVSIFDWTSFSLNYIYHSIILNLLIQLIVLQNIILIYMFVMNSFIAFRSSYII